MTLAGITFKTITLAAAMGLSFGAFAQSPPPERQTTTTTERSNDGVVTSTTTTTTRHYVYYGDHNIYFSPETKTYFWATTDGKWRSGAVLPPEDQPYVRNGGVQIDLDTDRPYERQEYVIKHYREQRDKDGDQ